MIVNIQNLCKSFGRVKAVDDVSFNIHAGQIFGFVGPNGAGKTTTMRILATLEEQDSGDVFFDSFSVQEDPEAARRSIGYVPDTLPSHRDITVHEFLDFFGRAYGLRGGKLRSAISDVVEFAGLSEILDKTLAALSKGMKQRVSVGRALIHNPPVMLLDEPAAGLDPRARVELRELLTALAEMDKAILISSHILTELTEICSGVVIIEKGRILANGSVNEVLNKSQVHRKLSVSGTGDTARLKQELLICPGVQDARIEGNKVIASIEVDDNLQTQILNQLISKGCPVSQFYAEETDLEDIFMEITKGEVQ